MSDETYSGWANYPTWAVNLWLSNDQSLYLETLERTQDVLSGTHPTSEYWTVAESRRFGVADTLKDWVEELGPDEASVCSDLIGWALAHVDWNEIADAWIENVSEQVA